ncbi:hypothetical protein C0J50_10274 [Silurus asotus]|uniref:Uncharacterized protein n=1 Tax=Silurus asotus TaxID=30991 RepID=A0AAD5B9H1_SILAS|nr:hypothetical protein C0J50_10274 [Silurus asotus]
MKKRSRRGRPYRSLSQSILGVQLDLRDLMRQVNAQLLILRMSKNKEYYTHTPPPTSPTSTRSALDLILSSSLSTTNIPADTPGRNQLSLRNISRSSTSQWGTVLKGYVILRDLERYLSRLVRDYTLLRAKS